MKNFTIVKIFICVILAAFVNAGYSQINVKGKVTDLDGNTLPGVNIVVKGSTAGTITDAGGLYSIEALAEDILVFSFIGYNSEEIPVGNKTTIDVMMVEDITSLEEVVVIGYGTSNKKDLVSSVSSIKSDVLENVPSIRVDQALQGRATGVEVTSNNGAPGAGTTIRIRGNSSINGNNDPLYVVDGFIAGTGFNLNNLNVNDIESVEVLKDATALSIYGTRGAAGVILITTKDGSRAVQGKPTISVNYYTTTQSIANEIDLLGGEDYINYINEAAQFVPGPNVTVNDVDLPLGLTDTSLPLIYDNPSETPTTDWLDLVNQRGSIMNADVSITGNGDKSNYYVSMNYFDQKGIIRGSGIERFVLRTNLDIKPSDKFKTGIRFNLSNFRREVNKINFQEIVNGVLPVRTVYDEDGNFTSTNPISGSFQRNPEADIQLRVDHEPVTNLTGNWYAEYELFKDFKLRTTVGAEFNFYKRNRYQPGTLPVRLANGDGGFAQINSTFRKNILNENTFTYDKQFGEHSFKILGGFTWQKNVAENYRASAEGFPNDAVAFNNLQLGSDPSTYIVSSGYNQRTLASFLGRINYSYQGKYLLTLVARQDGSSVFEEGNKYSFFPSVGFAWNLDEEQFIKDLDILDTFKLRGSYGIVGEQGVDPYNSLDFFNPENTYFNETLVSAVILDRPASENLQWEVTKQLDIGLELGFIDNRLTVEMDFYKKTTEDLLLSRDLANTAGGTQLQNVGSIENKGFEFGLNSVNIANNDLQWETQLVVSLNRSKVLDLGGDEFIGLQSTGNQGGASARLIVGETLPVFFGAEYLGTYKTAEEIIADGREGLSFLGSPRFTDLDGNGVINNEDFMILGSPQPDFYGGIRNTITYKGLSLDIFFQGQYGSEIFNVRTQTSFYGRGDLNLDPRVLDRWREGVNETSDVPRAGVSTSLFNPNSSVNVEDGSFLRLKQLSLAYNLPVEKMGWNKIFKSVNVYVSGNNVFLISDFKLGDPEVNNFTSSSTNNSFGGVSQGFATGQYPYAKSFTLGAKLQF